VAKIVAAGMARCARCGEPIIPGTPWDLDHADHPASHQNGWYLGPSHRRCNNQAKKSNRNQPKPQQTRAKALDFFNPKPTTGVRAIVC
jgi:hypothetical protein